MKNIDAIKYRWQNLFYFMHFLYRQNYNMRISSTEYDIFSVFGSGQNRYQQKIEFRLFLKKIN